MRRGFSVVETLVAVAILAAVGIAMLGAFSQSAKEARTTSEYSVSLFLAQKVVEEAIQSTYENPHVGQVLRTLDGTRMDVEDPLNPYFVALEDLAPPFGRLTAGTDLGVDVRATHLHRLYRDFNMTVNAREQTVPELPGTPPLIEELGVVYDWPGIKDTARDSRFPLLMAKPCISPVPTPLIAQDLPGMDTMIRQLLYQTAPGPSDLPTFVAAAGATLLLVRDMGSVVVVTEVSSTEASTLATAITSLTLQLPPTGPEDPDRRVKLAHLHEQQAATAWQALLYMKDPANRIPTGFTADEIGGRTRVSGPYLYNTLSNAIRLRDVFEYETRMALHHYMEARKSLTALGPRAFWQYTLERKVLDLAKLLVMIQETDDVTFVQGWIDFMLDLYSGRNRSITDFLTTERQAAAGRLAGIQNLHPLIRDRLSDTGLAVTALAQVRERVRQEFF